MSVRCGADHWLTDMSNHCAVRLGGIVLFIIVSISMKRPDDKYTYRQENEGLNVHLVICAIVSMVFHFHLTFEPKEEPSPPHT